MASKDLDVNKKGPWDIGKLHHSTNFGRLRDYNHTTVSDRNDLELAVQGHSRSNLYNLKEKSWDAYG